MNIPFFIAKRYLFSKRKRSVINSISIISLIGITISTIALIVILSVLNGFAKVATSLFNVFDPPILVEASEGKTFHLNSIPLQEISSLQDVSEIEPCVEENVLISYRSNQYVAHLKGITSGFLRMSTIDTAIFIGSFRLQQTDDIYCALLGADIDYQLGIQHNEHVKTPLNVYVPKRAKKTFGLNPEEAFNRAALIPAGAFQVSATVDNSYVLTHINFMRSLMEYEPDEVTSLGIALKKGANEKNAQQKIKTILGNSFTVKNRLEQEELFFKTANLEKIAVYLILSLIVFIATFNIIGSLSLLMLDKKKDIKTLQSIGADLRMIKQIFFAEGMLIAFTGIVAGFVIGGFVCWLQQSFGLIKLGGENFVISSFPVEIRLLDFVNIFLLVTFISAISVGFTVLSRIKLVAHK